MMRVSCRILYDLAARVQDLVQFSLNSFAVDDQGFGKCDWVCHKTHEPRSGFLSADTIRTLTDVYAAAGLKPGDMMFPHHNEKQLKKYFSNFFRDTVKLPIQSHDF